MKHKIFKLFLTTLLLMGYNFSAKADTFTVDGIKYETTSSNTVRVVQSSYTGDIVIPSSVTYNSTTYSVTSVGSFQNCSSLTSVTIPNSVTYLSSGTFLGCSSLTSVTIPNSVTSIEASVFLGCSSLTSVTIPNSVTSIGNALFRYCSSLTSVDIPNSVTSIGECAFEGCTSLTSITIPNSVTEIGFYAFHNCTGLTSVTIPNSVTYIDRSAFADCSNINIGYINVVDFNNENAVVSGIAQNVFYMIDGRVVTNLVIPDSVTEIKTCAFRKCTTLETIVIPNSVTSIGNQAFSGCSGLTSITIPNSVTYIGEWAFYSCRGLTSVTIPNSVTSIGYEAFRGCTGLTSVSIPNSVTSIAGAAFDGCTSLPVEGNIRYADTYLVEATDKTQTTYVIKEGTKWIGKSAFDGCTGLTSVTIPNSVTTIGYEAFRACSGLTSIAVMATNPSDITCGPYVFSSDIYSTAKLYVPAESIGAYRNTEPWSNFSNIEIYVPVTGISLDKSSITFTSAGVTETLIATITPTDATNKAITWTSSDETVATVDENGVVTSVGYGTAIITATAADGSGVTATCSVKVQYNEPVSVITDEEIADIDIDTEFINNHIDIFKENEFTSLDITRATSIEDGIVIPVNDNCIIYAPDGANLGNTKNVVVDGVCDNLVISEGQKFAPPIAFTATNASYSRTNLDKAWGTVCLPYEVSSDDNVTYYTTGTISGDVLTLTSTETLPAGTPAIYKSHNESEGKYSLNATATGVSVVGSVQSESVTDDDITLIGSFEKTVIDDVTTDASNEYYYISNGKFMHATRKLTINPFRAYFTVPKSAAPSNGFSIAVGEDDVTAISALTGEGDIKVVGIYGIDGKPQSDLQPGLNIVKLSNGKTKKILIK